MRLRLLALTALVFGCTPTGALADAFKKDQTPLPSDLSGADTTAAAGGGGGAGIGRLVFGLLVVVGLVLGLRWFLKRANRERAHQAAGSLQVVATTPLAQGRAVHLLRVGDELVLVGSAEHGVTPLRVYSPAEARTLEQSFGADGFGDTTGGSGSGSGLGGMLGDLRRRTAR